jgi:sarcosine oxidase subunit gamma
MAERPPLERRPAAVCVSPLLHALPAQASWVLRGNAQVMMAAGAALGLTLSTHPCRASVHGERAALWLGPDEQLLLVPESEGAAVGEALLTALSHLAHALVDVSHRQVHLELEGTAAAWCLNVGCPLDLDLASFPVGMCTRTVLAKAQIVLWRPAEWIFRVLAARSYADYVSRFLAEAARELQPSGQAGATTAPGDRGTPA